MANRRIAAEEKNAVSGRFFRETKIEMKKVVWPTKKEMVRYSVAVVVSVILVSFLIVAVDLVFTGLSRLFVSVVG